MATSRSNPVTEATVTQSKVSNRKRERESLKGKLQTIAKLVSLSGMSKAFPCAYSKRLAYGVSL